MSKEPLITKVSVGYSQTKVINDVTVKAEVVFESPVAGSEEYLFAKAADFVENQLKGEEANLGKGKTASKSR